MRYFQYGLWILSALSLFATAAAGQSVQQTWTRSNCAMCHGAQGQGGMADSLLTPERSSPALDRAFYDAIYDGMEEDGMPAYGEVLSEEEIWGLVVYIRELQQQARKERDPGPKPSVGDIVQTQHHAYKVESVVDDGLRIPWSVAFLPDGTMLSSERPGTLRIYDDDGSSTEVENLPVITHTGQGGLLGIAVHPDYDENGWVYLSYTHAMDGDSSNLMTRIVRGRIKDNQWTNQQVIFEAEPEHYHGGRSHFGSRIVFDHEGYVYFPIGDRGRPPYSQRLDRPNGSIFRLHDDGRIPEDNPFVDQAAALDAIWSYGHRNPQGLAFDPVQNKLWSTEHGPRGGDELNLIEKGGNYGWPKVSHGINYNGTPLETPWHDGDMIDPIWHWTPSTAACGLAIVSGDTFENWTGDFLAGGLAGQVLERLRVADGQVIERERLLEGIGRVRDVVCGPDGNIYVVLNNPDVILRLVPADG